MVVTSTICPALKVGLRIFGVWPDVSFGVGRRLIHLSTTFLIQYFQYQYIIGTCKRGEMQNFIDSLPGTVYFSLTGFKMMIVWKYHGVISELLATVDTDWREYLAVNQHLHVMVAKASISRFCTHFLMTFNTFTGALYFGSDVLKANAELLQGYNVTSRPLPINIQLPFDAEKSPVYEVVALSLYLHAVSMSFIENIFTALVVTLVFHACGQIEIICQHLKTTSGEVSNYGSPVYSTKMLVDKHNNVISFSENIDKLFSYIILMQVFGNTIIMCFLGLFIMISQTPGVFYQLKIISVYVAIMLQILILCFLGEHLSFKSRSLGDAAYDSLWYNMLPSYGRNILLIIIRSQKQLTITAGGVADLSLEAFTSIMKASASYMSVLNAMY